MIRGTFILVALASFTGLYAQQSGQIGFFDFLPQTVYANPALRPAGKINIGIPGLSQINFDHGNNWFNASEYFAADANGKVTLNNEKVLASIDENAFTGQNLNIELIHAGFRFGKHYIHARAAERVQIGLTIPKDLFYLGVYGNAGKHEFEGNTVNFSGLNLDAIHFREYTAGYNYELNEKWTLGIAAKALYGMERIQTEKSSLKLRTDPETYDMQTSGSFVVNTSGIYSLAKGEGAVQNNIKSYLLGLKNTGFGGDFGVVYRPLKKLRLELSANDIGFIKWKNDVARYGTEDAFFAYKGIDLTDFIFLEGSDFNDAFQARLDSLLDDLENAYNFERTEQEFTTSLNGFMRYAASYEVLGLKKYQGNVWVNVFHGILSSQVPLTFSLGYNQKVWKVIQADIHITKRAKFSPAIGCGLSLNAGPFQIYLLAENLHFANYSRITVIDKANPGDETSLIYFNNPQDVRLNVGINLTFGMKTKDSRRGVPMKR